MKRYILLFCLLTLLSSGASISYAQQKRLTLEEIADPRSEVLTVSLPNINYWIDDDHLMMSKRGNPLLIHAKTGQETPTKYPSSPRSKALSTGQKRENAQYSPDSTWIAYTLHNNLFAEEVATGRKVQYTTDGSETILNGVASWVYYEEILDHATATFWWSPDSKHIAFFSTDESQVPTFPVFDARNLHGSLKMTRYPKAGDPNPQVKVGIVGVEGGAIVWADFDKQADQYFGKGWWTPDGASFWLQWMPRKQNELKVYAIHPLTGSKNAVYTETSETWVDWKSNIHFLKKQKAFILQNTTDGWDQIYMYAMDGKLKHPITKGKNFWRTEIMYIDEVKQTIYFNSFGESPLSNDFYSVKWDGSSLKRLTFGDYHHNITLSPSAKYFITRYSNLNTPPCMALVDCQTGKVVREIANSKSPSFHEYVLPKKEIVSYTTPDGLTIQALIFYPMDMDSTKQYPVLINTYGGPDHPQVQNRWWGGAAWYSHQGVIRVVLEHRGSGFCGKKGLDYIYRNLGKYEMADFIEFVKQQLYTRPYVNRAKIGIEGHSYGGYMAALAVTKGSEFFKYGLSNAGVADWTLYDSHYTERYMDTPVNNPEGYKGGSVLTYLENYKADNYLYIRHGQIDDNVHIQNSLQLAQELQLKNKPFKMMVFPSCAHAFIGRTLSFTYNDAIRFWYECLLDRKDVPEELFR